VAEPGANETYTIQLGVPTGGATINDGVGSGSIVDTTAQPTISIGTAFAVAEGNTAQFSVSLSTTSTSPITVPWTRTNNTTTNADFTGSGSGTVTFVPGDGHETIMIPISADGMHEPGPNELYSVVLGTPTGPATVAVSSGGGSIVDTTPEPSMSINDRLAINEGTTATFTVTLTGPADETISVPWTRTNGTTVNADFTGSATGTLTFLAGDTSKTISIPLLDDGVNEPGGNETYSVGLGAITGPAAMSRATGNGSIVDVNATPGISINDRLALNEGTNAVFTVTLSNASSSQVEVPWSRINGTTTNGDFTGASVGTVIFAPGDTSETITIGLASDTIDEVGANETYSVVLGEVSGTATITKGTGSGSIVDQTPQPTVSIGTAFAVKEGATANFSVSLSSTSTSVITVPWTRANGTTSNSDFTGVSSGTVTFAAGDGNETILIPINADGLYEPGPNETYTVTLGTPTGPATVPSPVGQGTIDDEDVVPTVSIGPSSATESAGAMTFTVTLSGPSDVAIDVDYTTGPPATATVGTDYTPAFGTVTIPADALSATFDV
ncbi:MAG: hypothetical protein KDB69_10835, partial [Acidimicrobiia bacterium]|nr:hypothetical protein [Acidimicrobiia bacterium]